MISFLATGVQSMAQNPSDRIAWAVEMLAVEPNDPLLEIGCGHGVAVSLVCERLVNGTITAIDRSEKMLEMARKRNKRHAVVGKALFQCASLGKAEFGTDRFNKIFAIHVNLFREQPSREIEIVKNLLTPEGALYLCHQPPVAGKTEEFAAHTAKALEDHDFSIHELLFAELKPVPAFCIIAKPG
jgi:cyclopropane fatty-acyl-phospholipid synthase-like methyltransferase